MTLRRFAIALLAVCLLPVGVATSTAQPPLLTADPGGHRVEVPEAGLALTVPEGWLVWVPMQELDAPELPAHSSLWQVLMASNTHEYPEAGAGGCQIVLVRVDDPDAGTVALEDVARWGNPFGNDPGFGESTTTEVMLPAGTSSRLDVVEHAEDGDWYGATYDLAAPNGIVWLICIGFGERPDDDWLSIARTLEFIPLSVPAIEPITIEAWQPPEVVPSSASPDDDLAALFPAWVNGRPPEVQSWSWEEWVARQDPGSRDTASAMEAFVASRGKTLEDLEVSTTLLEPRPGNYATIAAVRLRGVDAGELFEPVIELMLGTIEHPDMEWRSVGDTWVIRIRDASLPGAYPMYAYPVDDSIWLVQADQALRGGIIAALPQQLDEPDSWIPGSLQLGPFEGREEVRVSHILYAPNDDWSALDLDLSDPAWNQARQQAETAAADLRAISDRDLRAIAFGERAHDESDGPSATEGWLGNPGDLGYFTQEVMVSEFADPLFERQDLRAGDIVGPTRTEFGWHVVMFIDRCRDEHTASRTYLVTPVGDGQITGEQVDKARRTLQQRLQVFGLERPLIQSVTAGKMSVELPVAIDETEVVRTLGSEGLPYPVEVHLEPCGD